MDVFSNDPMLSKMIVGFYNYNCSSQIIRIAEMLYVENTMFYHPNDRKMKAVNFGYHN